MLRARATASRQTRRLRMRACVCACMRACRGLHPPPALTMRVLVHDGQTWHMHVHARGRFTPVRVLHADVLHTPFHTRTCAHTLAHAHALAQAHTRTRTRSHAPLHLHTHAYTLARAPPSAGSNQPPELRVLQTPEESALQQSPDQPPPSYWRDDPPGSFHVRNPHAHHTRVTPVDLPSPQGACGSPCAAGAAWCAALRCSTAAPLPPRFNPVRTWDLRTRHSPPGRLLRPSQPP